MCRVALAVAMGAVGLVAMAAPAGAVKVKGAGTVSCSYGTTMTFSPALAPGAGTPVAANGSELITLAPATIGSCTGTLTSGSVPVSGTNAKAFTFRIKAVSFHGTHYAGGCLFFDTVQLRIKHTTVDWIAPTGLLKPTNVAPGTASLGSDPEGNLGFSFSGSATGSFAGAAGLDLFFDAPSTSALQGCLAGTGTVPALTVDANQSSISLG